MSETITASLLSPGKGAGKRVISIAFVEIEKQKTEPQGYALPYPDGR